MYSRLHFSKGALEAVFVFSLRQTEYDSAKDSFILDMCSLDVYCGHMLLLMESL